MSFKGMLYEVSFKGIMYDTYYVLKLTGNHICQE